MKGNHIIKQWSSTQKFVTLSSAKAELGGIVKGTAEGIGIQSLAADIGLRIELEVHADASAAIGICRRQGIGKVRHLRTQGLWVQEVRVSGRISYKKILGEKNPADLMTKHLDASTMNRHLEALDFFFIDGRAHAAPSLCSVALVGNDMAVAVSRVLDPSVGPGGEHEMGTG